MTPEEREIQLRERLERIESLEQEVKKRCLLYTSDAADD